MAARVTLRPGQAVEIPYLLAWHYPNKYSHSGEWMGNHYCTGWPDAESVAKEILAGLPAAVSNTAGTFVCNNVFYALMDLAARHPIPMRGGFLHIPYVPAQTARTKGWFGRKKQAVTGFAGSSVSRVSGAADSVVARVSGTVPSGTSSAPSDSGNLSRASSVNVPGGPRYARRVTGAPPRARA